MPIKTPGALNNYFKTSGYALSFVVGAPINAFIIYRLLSKEVPKSYYYRLLIFMCSVDIYQAVFGEVDFWGDKLISGFENKNKVVRTLFLINNEILYDTYTLQSFLCLIVCIHWKTVLKKHVKIDKIMYIVSIAYFSFLQSFDITYEYLPLEIMKKHKRLDKILEEALNYTEIVYFILYSTISIYCLIAIRRVDTKSYSAATLKAFKRMALVHFIQCGLVVLELAYHYIGQFILIEWELSLPEDSPEWKYVDQVYTVYNDIDFFYRIIKPFVRSIFLVWALRNLLKTQSKERSRSQVQSVPTLRSNSRVTV